MCPFCLVDSLLAECGGAGRISPTKSRYRLQETSGDTPAAIVVIFVVSATAGQAAGETANGVLHLVDGPASSFVISSDNGQAFGHAANGVLHLLDGAAAFTFVISSDNRQAFGDAANGVLDLIDGSASTAFFLLSLPCWASHLLAVPSPASPPSPSAGP